MGAPAVQAPTSDAPARKGGGTRSGPAHALRADAKIDPMKALSLKLKGLTDNEIARACDVSERRVGQVLAMMKPLIRAHEAGQRLFALNPKAEDELLDGARALILQNMTDPAVIAAADLRSSALAYDKLHLARRLRAGESTSNASLHVHVGSSLSSQLDTLPDRRKDADRSDEAALVVDIDPPAQVPETGRPGGKLETVGTSAPSRSTPLAGGASFAAAYALAVAPVLTRKPRGKKSVKKKPTVKRGRS